MGGHVVIGDVSDARTLQRHLGGDSSRTNPAESVGRNLTFGCRGVRHVFVQTLFAAQ